MRKLPLPLQTLPGILGALAPQTSGRGEGKGVGSGVGGGSWGFRQSDSSLPPCWPVHEGDSKALDLLPLRAPAPMCVSAAVADRLLAALAQQARLQDIVFRRSGMPTFNSASSDIVFRRFGNAGVPAVTAFRRFGMPSREMIRRRPLALNCVAVCLGASGHHTSRPHIRSQTCFPPLDMQVQDRSQQFSLVTLAGPKGNTPAC